jgi:hypothetical protein
LMMGLPAGEGNLSAPDHFLTGYKQRWQSAWCPQVLNKGLFLPNKFCCEKKKNPWPKSASELYRPSDRRLSAKLVPTFADRGCHVVSVTDPYGRILSFLDREFCCELKVIT